MLPVSAPECRTVSSAVAPHQICPQYAILQLIPVRHLPTALFSFHCIVSQANDTTRCGSQLVTLNMGSETMTCRCNVIVLMFGVNALQNYEPTLPPMLDAGIEVMIYAGVEDLICNWLGNYRWVNSLPWTGSQAWAASELKPWMVDGSQAGEVRQASGLTFVKVAGAGHMVPMVSPLFQSPVSTHLSA